MKVKEKKKNNPMTRIGDELHKLGFVGGEVNSVRGKKEFDYVLKGRLPFQQVGLSAVRPGSFNLCVISIVHSVKDDSISWKYDDDESDRHAKGNSGLHSRLVHAIGRQPED